MKFEKISHKFISGVLCLTMLSGGFGIVSYADNDVKTSSQVSQNTTYESKDNIDLVIVTLNDPNDFQNHVKLYKKYFESYNAVKVLDKKNIRVKDYDDKVDVIIENDYYALVNGDEVNKLKVEYDMFKEKNISNGDWIGVAKVYLGDYLLHQENLFAKVREKTKIKDWFND